MEWWREQILSASRLLAKASIEQPQQEAYQLWEYATEYPLAQWNVHPHPLNLGYLDTYHEMIQRRMTHEPFAYIIGKREFMGLALSVNPQVLIPRPETELLVETTLQVLKGHAHESLNIVDVGCGSGAIALALAKYGSHTWQIFGSDISANALDIARKNGERHSVSVRWFVSNLLEVVPPVEVIVANLPYVDEQLRHSLQPELSFEPSHALYAAHGGMEVLARLIREAAAREELRYIFLEIGYDQKDRVISLLQEMGFLSITARCDLNNQDRVVWAQKG